MQTVKERDTRRHSSSLFLMPLHFLSISPFHLRHLPPPPLLPPPLLPHPTHTPLNSRPTPNTPHPAPHTEQEEEDLVDLASDNRREKADVVPVVPVTVHTGKPPFTLLLCSALLYCALPSSTVLCPLLLCAALLYCAVSTSSILCHAKPFLVFFLFPPSSSILYTLSFCLFPLMPPHSLPLSPSLSLPSQRRPMCCPPALPSEAPSPP